MSRNDDDEDSSGVADSLEALERLSRLMRAQGHAHGLNPAQWEALRYVARANHLSNTPGALTRYLGATKGTISQTVLSLEKKGFITKTAKAEDARSVSLALTEAGRALLLQDGLIPLRRAIDDLGRKTRRRFDRALAELLHAETLRQKAPGFGTCSTCRYHREGGSTAPDTCMKVNQPLSKADSQLLCIEHVERA